MKLTSALAPILGLAFFACPRVSAKAKPIACDDPANFVKGKMIGSPNAWTFTDDKAFYLAPGQSSCGPVYTDNSNVVCMNQGWQGSAIRSRCGSWIKMKLGQNTAYAQVQDVCGAVPNSTFGCNDLYVTRQVFEQLAGDKKAQAKAYQAGHLPGSVEWHFTTEPCFACAGGYRNGARPDGSPATCTGFDEDGFLRCGRRTGSDRIRGPDVAKVCNKEIASCPNDKFPFAPPKSSPSGKNRMDV